ncbi:MAG: hypothetical protein BWZ10_01988 [candidate division BRC1 bacterium ADurb.BinA364]|nr:MAG: hypothetical protein BWZ10_01988 [candidate division BRC1 bacterium ADurb.BinA364]
MACFGGKLNTRLGGQWTGERRLPSLEGKPLGFVDLAIGADNLVYAVWEEGDALDKEEKNGESSILFARMNLQPEEEAATAPPVGLWDRFEAQIGNSKPYRDPFRDVSLDVSYIRPDGTAVGFWGFHDGGTVWKIRFMPDQLGLWKYEARFSDGTPGGRGAFECVESDIPGMFSIYPENPIWYAYKGGQPVWVRSLHIGDRFFAANWSPEERALFLDWVGEQGYNMLSVASHYLNRQEADRGLSWKTPALWPPNPEEYRLLEEMMDNLARRKIIVYPFAGFFGKRSNYPREQADQQLHIRYALARLGPYWNTMPNVAGPEPNVGNIWMQSSEVEYLARQIKKFDVFDHPLSVHNKTGDNPYLDAAWNEYVTLQGPKTLDRAKLSEGLLRNLNPAKPLFAQETLWSDNENHPAYTDEDIRKNAFVIGVSGATFCFGDMKGNSSTGFSGTLAMDERNQARHDIVKAVWDFFETIPWWRMNPRQDLVDAGYCLAKPGERYLVYLDEPGTVNVKLEGGPYKVEWIDARDTAKRRPAPSTRDGQGLKSPAEGDWLLYLTPAAETKLRAAADADR